MEVYKTMKTVIKILRQYPECELQFAGCGFIIDHYFLTAGHVVNSELRHFAEINNELIPLENPKFLSLNENCPDCFDLAIFELKEKYYSFTLSEDIPKIGMKLNGKCFPKNERDSIISFELEISHIQGLYFEGETSVQTYQGSSGSPLFYNDNVFGMLVAGNCNKDGNKRDLNHDINYCRFLSSKHISEKLKSIQNSQS